MHALVLLCIDQYTKFQMPSFTNCKDTIGGKIFFKKGYDHAPSRGGLSP